AHRTWSKELAKLSIAKSQSQNHEADSLTCRNVQHNSISRIRAVYKTAGCRNDASASMKLAKGQWIYHIEQTPSYVGIYRPRTL
ncbi:hypothetical protein M5D96_006326, partial [Drosophila gunungcola]